MLTSTLLRIRGLVGWAATHLAQMAYLPTVVTFNGLERALRGLVVRLPTPVTTISGLSGIR